MQTPRHLRRHPGFTLTELLVSIAIVIVLAALAFTVANKAIRRAGAVRDMSNMRQVWNSMMLYPGDNNDLLPGPLNTGQRALYGLASSGRVSYYIASYLGYPDPKPNDFLEAMSYSWQRDSASKLAPCFFIRENVPTTDGFTTIRPWGHPLRTGDDRKPKTLAAVLSRIDASRTWAITDIDQQHPDVGNADWKPTVPKEMPHGTYRIAVYFDGRAGKVDKNNDPL